MTGFPQSFARRRADAPVITVQAGCMRRCWVRQTRSWTERRRSSEQVKNFLVFFFSFSFFLRQFRLHSPAGKGWSPGAAAESIPDGAQQPEESFTGAEMMRRPPSEGMERRRIVRVRQNWVLVLVGAGWAVVSIRLQTGCAAELVWGEISAEQQIWKPNLQGGEDYWLT